MPDRGSEYDPCMAPGTLTRGRLADHPTWARALASEELEGRLVMPLIVSDAVEDRERVDGAAACERVSITEAIRDARAGAAAGIAGVLVLGSSDRRDEHAMIAAQPDHVVPRAVRAIKDAVPDLAVATDVCVCPYVVHGQCVLFAQGGADVAGTLARLGEIAIRHAEAGAELLIPSGMLDGTVGAIRGALGDAHAAVPVAAMAKLESALHAVERTAVGIAPVEERAVPLLDPSDAAAAVARVRRDVAAGADTVVVTPGLIALDVVASLRATIDRAIVVLHTAGEHALFAAGSDADGARAEREAFAASRRAGADLVIAYGLQRTLT